MSEIIKDKNEALRRVAEGIENVFFLSEELREDRDVMLAAVQHNANAFDFVGKKLRADPELVLTALSTCPSVIELIELPVEDWRQILNTWQVGKAAESALGKTARRAHSWSESTGIGCRAKPSTSSRERV